MHNNQKNWLLPQQLSLPNGLMAPTFIRPSFTKPQKRHQVSPLTKQTIKYLGVVKNPRARLEALRSSPPEVYKKTFRFCSQRRTGAGTVYTPTEAEARKVSQADWNFGE